jgi:hypothetical protein
VDLVGAVVTVDALHTARANLDWLASDKKARYIAVVKQNQPLLHARIKALPWRRARSFSHRPSRFALVSATPRPPSIADTAAWVRCCYKQLAGMNGIIDNQLRQREVTLRALFKTPCD